jgi:glycerophosphoryl diester phosphodiesterase
MKNKLLLIIIFCIVFLGRCSVQEDFKVSVSKSIKGIDTVLNNGDEKDTITNSIEKIAGLIITKSNVVVAHRGAWKKNNLPENSIASLKEAIRLKCAGSEFDIWLTADDSLVINHDPLYYGLSIADVKYSELVKFSLSNGEKIPTLRDFFLTWVNSGTATTTKLFCELKPDYIYKKEARLKTATEKTYNLIKSFKLESNIVVMSFDYNSLKQIKIYDKAIVCQYLGSNAGIEKLALDGIGPGYYADYFIGNLGFLDAAKKSSLIAAVWTVNNSKWMDYFVTNKIDYIGTDEPELLFERITK